MFVYLLYHVVGSSRRKVKLGKRTGLGEVLFGMGCSEKASGRVRSHQN